MRCPPPAPNSARPRVSCLGAANCALRKMSFENYNEAMGKEMRFLGVAEALGGVQKLLQEVQRSNLQVRRADIIWGGDKATGECERYWSGPVLQSCLLKTGHLCTWQCPRFSFCLHHCPCPSPFLPLLRCCLRPLLPNVLLLRQ